MKFPCNKCNWEDSILNSKIHWLSKFVSFALLEGQKFINIHLQFVKIQLNELHVLEPIQCTLNWDSRMIFLLTVLLPANFISYWMKGDIAKSYFQFTLFTLFNSFSRKYIQRKWEVGVRIKLIMQSPVDIIWNGVFFRDITLTNVVKWRWKFSLGDKIWSS